MMKVKCTHEGWEVISKNLEMECDDVWSDRLEECWDEEREHEVISGGYGWGTDVIFKWNDIYVWEFESDEMGSGTYVVEEL